MAVAPIRWAYSRPCRFYQDQTVETRIIWYFAAPGAAVLPYRTVFWDRQHDYGGGAPTTVGEVDDTRVIGREAVPPVVVLPGDHCEGTAADFMGESSEPQSTRDGVQAVECQRLPPTCGFYCGDLGPDVQTECCPDPIPSVLRFTATFTDDFAALSGVYYATSPPGSGQSWRVNVVVGGLEAEIVLGCFGAGFGGWLADVSVIRTDDDITVGESGDIHPVGSCGPPLSMSCADVDLSVIGGLSGSVSIDYAAFV